MPIVLARRLNETKPPLPSPRTNVRRANRLKQGKESALSFNSENEDGIKYQYQDLQEVLIFTISLSPLDER